MASQAKERYEEAWSLYYQGKLLEATIAAKQALERDPDNPNTKSLLALCYYFSEEDEKAVTLVDEVFSGTEHSALAVTIRALLLKEYKADHDGARADLDHALKLDPDCLFTRVRSGINYWNLDKPQEAMREIEATLKRQPDYFYALRQRARLKSEQGDYSGAIADYKRFLEVYPVHPIALFCYAYCLNVSGCPDEALTAYTTFLKEHPSDTDASTAHYNRGLIFEQRGDMEAALADFEQAIKLDEKYYLAFLNRGGIRLERKQIDEAIQDFLTALSIAPQHQSALKQLTDAYQKKGDLVSALATRAKLRELENKSRWHNEDKDVQLWNDAVYSHYQNELIPVLRKTGDRFVEYWEVTMQWGVQTSQSIYEGTSGYVHSGKVGAGYLALSEKNVWIINLGEISKKFTKTRGVLGRIVLAGLRNFDMTSKEKSDRTFRIPHVDIQYTNNADGVVSLHTGAEVWEILPFWSEDKDEIFVALSEARKGAVGNFWEPLPLPTPAPKEGFQTKDEVYEAIEKLKKLLDIQAITQKQYDEKVQELLERL